MTIPVLPCPPDTLIIPLFFTFPLYALIESDPVIVPSSSTAIPDESELPALFNPEIFIVPPCPFSNVIFSSETLEESFNP